MKGIVNLAVLGIFLLTFSSKSYCQGNEAYLEKFADSYRFRVGYPSKLIENCIPTAAMLKIVVGDKSEVVEMALSDSADPALQKAFLSAKSRLDLKSLNAYLKLEKIKSSTIFFPVYVSLTNVACVMKSVELDVLKKLFSFGNSNFAGELRLMKPIDIHLITTEEF